MKSFALHRPDSLSDAVYLLRNCTDPKQLAGGMTMLPTLKQRLAEPSDLIDLATVPGLTQTSANGRAIEIGAMTRHAVVAAAPDVRAAIPALAALAGGIGDPQVRNRGTIAGSIANADPAADYPAAVLGLGAMIRTDRREIAADDFFTGMFDTALEDDEIIVSVSFPVPEVAAYVKMPNQASRYAVAGVFLARFPGEVRVAVTGAAPSVFRAEPIEQLLKERFEVSSLDGIRISPDGLNNDIHADAQYRANLVRVLVRRAVGLALAVSA